MCGCRTCESKTDHVKKVFSVHSAQLFCVFFVICHTKHHKVNQNYVWACWNRTWNKETALDFFGLLQWSLHHLWLGTYPQKDWRGIEFPAGSKERDKAGQELANGWRAVVCAWSGDMDFYMTFMGLPNYNSGQPCALCRPE